MSLLTNRMMEYLKDQGVHFEVIHHKLDYTAQKAAQDTHTPGHQFAKSVVLCVDDGYALAVIPAPRKIDFSKARESLGAEVTLASEEEVGRLFPDCEIGAEPPFGHLYGLTAYVSPELAEADTLTFNAGTHHEAVRMRYEDFERLVKPRRMDLAWHG